ncbi:MAG: hypothetical protein QM758_13860 [Armatimonas sp.]
MNQEQQLQNLFENILTYGREILMSASRSKEERLAIQHMRACLVKVFGILEFDQCSKYEQVLELDTLLKACYSRIHAHSVAIRALEDACVGKYDEAFDYLCDEVWNRGKDSGRIGTSDILYEIRFFVLQVCRGLRND